MREQALVAAVDVHAPDAVGAIAAGYHGDDRSIR